MDAADAAPLPGDRVRNILQSLTDTGEVDTAVLYRRFSAGLMSQLSWRAGDTEEPPGLLVSAEGSTAASTTMSTSMSIGRLGSVSSA